MDNYHIPVLLQTVCDYLDIKRGESYLDATIGGGGHTSEIIRRGGKVIGLDQDQDAIEFCQKKFLNEVADHDLILIKSAFSHLDEVLNSLNITQISGVILDLGVSMHQIQTPARGFSFQSSGPLDMRMDQTLSQTAFTLIRILTPKQLNQIFLDFGEIKNGYHLAEKIIQEKPETTDELVTLIKDRNLIRPLFQALRIAVNGELLELEIALPKAYALLKPGGRIVIISFHSLEDRLIKNLNYGQSLTKNPIFPSPEEIIANPASKSAKLRAFLKPYD